MESRVSIFYVRPDGEVWADYLFQKLGTKEYEIDCEKIEFTKRSEKSLQSSVLNVFFVTPDFLDLPHSGWQDSVDTNRCILVLTGTVHEDLEESTCFSKCDNVNDFFIYELNETEESVRDLLISIISKYEENDPNISQSPQPSNLHHTSSVPKDFRPINLSRSLGREPEGFGRSPNLLRRTVPEERGGNYDVLPNYQRQVNGVRDVLYKDGKLYILLWRQAEGTLHVKLHNRDITPEYTHCAVYEMEHDGKESANLSVIQEGSVIGEHLVQIQNTADDSNPTVIQCKELPRTSAVSVGTQTDEHETKEGRSIISSHKTANRESLYVNIDDVSRASSEPGMEKIPEMSRENKLEIIRKILISETDPEELLCQCLGIDKGVRHLDEKMTSMVQSVETLRHLSFSGRQSSTEEKSTWPTLVHFGAHFNLLNFCDVLLSNPLMYGACVTRNKNGHMPHDIARIQGHTELSEMLKHFSEFVKSEKERDSGISSSFSSTPRMSTGSGEQPPPPVPHRPHYSGDNYIDMSGLRGHDDYVNEREMGKQHNQQRKKLREVSGDGGFCGSLEIDDDCFPMSPKAHADPERRTLTGTDDDCDPILEHHRKDVVHMLGMTPPVSPDENKKIKAASKLKKLFFGGKKNRSQSEPQIFAGEAYAVKRSSNAKSYVRDSAHSSSSTTSTYSDSSCRDEDGLEVQMRDSKHSGKKVKGFLKKAKRRQSQRIKQAMEDDQIKVPALPARLAGPAEVF